MNKVSIIDSYLNRCAEEHTTESAEKLVNDILGVFSNDINGLILNLDLNSYKRAMTGTPVNYIEDVELLSKKLEFCKSKLLDEEQNQKVELEKLHLQAEIARTNVNVNATGGNADSTSTATATSTVTISIEQTIKAITEISNEVFSQEEKENLQDALYAMEGMKSTKNKSKFWKKAKPVLSFLTDKGADALIAVAPYIITALQTM